MSSLQKMTSLTRALAALRPYRVQATACSSSNGYHTYVNEPAMPIPDKEPRWVKSAEEACDAAGLASSEYIPVLFRTYVCMHVCPCVQVGSTLTHLARDALLLWRSLVADVYSYTGYRHCGSFFLPVSLECCWTRKMRSGVGFWSEQCSLRLYGDFGSFDLVVGLSLTIFFSIGQNCWKCWFCNGNKYRNFNKKMSDPSTFDVQQQSYCDNMEHLFMPTKFA